MKKAISLVFNKFEDDYLKKYSATITQYKVIDCIKLCKTEKLGFNTEACTDCGAMHTHYNSCGNRHCPNCQAVHKDRWMLQKQYDLLPVKYHHTVFTVPAELRTLFLYNKTILYNLLYTAAWETIQSFAQNPKNRIEAKMGMIAILHTWKQNLDYHPHLHCIIPAGGITTNNKWKSSPTSGDYLFNTQTLSAVFKGKFLSALKQMHKDGNLKFWDLKNQSKNNFFYQLKEKLYAKNWVVYSKKSFKNEQSVFEYLGRYTHRIAISNHRIRSITDKEVIFEYTDRADDYKKKLRKVSGVKFIKLFLQHVLPARFMKIRNYGILSSRNKTKCLTQLYEYFELDEYQKPPKLLIIEVLELVYGVKPGICKHCGGKMVLVKSKTRPRASPKVA